MILILNGPNLNWVGKREPGVYGTESLEEYLKGFGTAVTVHFSNIEGEIINALQKAENNDSISAVILNAGGYSHTSIAIADTIRAMIKPVVS
jgi:3-dehydroquinate dehydratase-2